MRAGAALALLVVLAACGDPRAPVLEEAQPSAFDTTIAYDVPLLPGGAPATVTHVFTATANTAPLQWSRRVTRGLDTLLLEKGDSADLDPMFTNTAAFGVCPDPGTCRKLWFVGTFARADVETLAPGPLDAYEREVARGFLLDDGIAEAEADRLLDSLDAQYATQERVTVQFTESPTARGPVWTYHPGMQKLLPVSLDDE